VGPPARLAAHPLNAQPVVSGLGAGPPPVSAPADQTTARLALRLGTPLRQLDRSSRTQVSLGVLFDGLRKMDYDYPTVETPSRVVAR